MSAPADAFSEPMTSRWAQRIFAILGATIIPVNAFVYFATPRACDLHPLFVTLAILQCLCGIAACIGFFTIRERDAEALLLGAVGVLVGLLAPYGIWLGVIGQAFCTG
jgi:hypothetical protein